MLFWLFNKKIFVLISLLTILAGYGFVLKFFSFNFNNYDKVPKNKIRILSYNIRNFNLYNWKNNIAERLKFLELIEKENPDIICFQEFYSSDKGHFNNIEFIIKKLNLPYYSFQQSLTLRKTDHWGLSVFSKYPILNTQQIDFDNSKLNSGMSADLHINNEIIRLINVHFESVHFIKSDYSYIEQLTQEKDPDIESSRKIFGKLKHGFIKRGNQVDLVEGIIKQSPYPIIVCGDFNDHPISYTYNIISNNLQDAFLEKGFGIGQTYTGSFAPFRIDYILMDKKFKIENCWTIKKPLSDHYPVVCDFSP